MRARAGFGAIAVAVVLLSGCAAAPADEPETDAPRPDPTPTSTETTSAEQPVSRVFRMPTTCSALVTSETAARFASEGLDHLGGPGGLYGEDYFPDATPEERAGGISCVWGDEDAPATTVVVSVAPVSAGTRASIVRGLIESGLIESQLEGAISYARLGDDVSSPGELHVIRSDSWISVFEALGGQERFQHATELVDEVTAQVYVER